MREITWSSSPNSREAVLLARGGWGHTDNGPLANPKAAHKVELANRGRKPKNTERRMNIDYWRPFAPSIVAPGIGAGGRETLQTRPDSVLYRANVHP